MYIPIHCIFKKLCSAECYHEVIVTGPNRLLTSGFSCSVCFGSSVGPGSGWGASAAAAWISDRSRFKGAAADFHHAGWKKKHRLTRLRGCFPFPVPPSAGHGTVRAPQRRRIWTEILLGPSEPETLNPNGFPSRKERRWNALYPHPERRSDLFSHLHQTKKCQTSLKNDAN